VLRDVELAIEPAEWVGILGPNGAGKSTLLRLMTGLLPPSAGTVELDGQPLAAMSRAEIAHRIAVVPQPSSLPFSASVESVVALGRLPHEDRLRGLRPEDRMAVGAAIERVGLGRLVGPRCPGAVAGRAPARPPRGRRCPGRADHRSR